MSTSKIPTVGGQVVGTVKTRGVNELPLPVPRNMNPYNLSKDRFCTLKFGEVTPVYSEEVIPKDQVTFYNDVVLYNARQIKTPILNDIFMHRAFFYVPRQAIMPNSWDYINGVPLNGSDIPADAVCKIDLYHLFTRVITLVKELRKLDPARPDQNQANQMIFDFYMILLFCRTFSADGLIKRLGKTIDPLLSSNNYYVDLFDMATKWERSLADTIVGQFGWLNQNPELSWDCSFGVYNDNGDLVPNVEQFNKNVEFLLYSGSLRKFTDFQNIPIPSDDFLGSLIRWSKAPDVHVDVEVSTLDQSLFVFDPSTLIGYQMCMAQFMTNDVVDDIYSAKRWLSVMKSLQRAFFSTSSQPDLIEPQFSYEGGDVSYDVFSYHQLNAMIDSTASLENLYNNWLPFFMNLLLPQLSLKYGDYFTGGRLNPLANAGADITVGSNTSIMSLSKSVLMARFDLVMQRAGSLIESQRLALQGIAPAQGNNAPKFLSHQKVLLGKNMVVNTAEKQGNMNINFAVNGISDKMFNTVVDDFGFIIGVVYFDSKSVYTHATEKFFNKFTRNDMFNPLLQNFGDDEILRREFDSRVPNNEELFSYTSRFNDLRQKFDMADSGFLTSRELYSWLYTPSNKDDSNLPSHSLNSFFLRTLPSTFDKFYVSNTETGSDRFHFALQVKNVVQAYRQPTLTPDLLM